MKGGGVRAWPRRKDYFFEALKKNSQKKTVATKRDWGKALVAGTLKKSTFLRLPLADMPVRSMVLILDSNSEIGAHARSNLCNLIC